VIAPRAAVAAALVLLSGCGLAFYHPDHKQRATPARAHVAFEPLSLKTDDGVSIAAWRLHARTSSGAPLRGTVVHFHGNAENMSAHFRFASWLTAEGYEVIVFDYRGYGRSEGEPSREGLVLDGKAVLDYVARDPLLQDRDVFILGQSLGGAVAVPTLARWLAAPSRALNVRALILDSSFATYRGVARARLAALGFLGPLVWPLGLLASDDASPVEAIGRLEVPLLFIHSEGDPVVPFAEGWALFEASDPSRSELWKLSGGGHLRALKPGSPYRARLVEYLRARAS
jgi:pimeloyl-ACP methyl ester carboxylesterase